jgi:hypothetical protein
MFLYVAGFYYTTPYCLIIPYITLEMLVSHVHASTREEKSLFFFDNYFFMLPDISITLSLTTMLLESIIMVGALGVILVLAPFLQYIHTKG